MEFPERFKQGTLIYYIMNFEVKKRDGPARIGELKIDDKRVITPNILFVNTSRFKAPDFADAIITNSDLEIEKPALKILGGMFSQNIGKKGGNFQVSDYFFYPKDLPKELHLSAMKLYAC